MLRKLPIGFSDFKEVVQEKIYVDKSLFIRDVITSSAHFMCILRPHRFGKTLNISMLRYFFEKTAENHRALFEGLDINNIPEVMEKQGQFPVIHLTFKDLRQSSFEDFFYGIQDLIADEFERHTPTIEASLNEYDLAELKKYRSKQTTQREIEASLKKLSNWLHKATGEKVVLLIDEYDTPIQAAYSADYYEEGTLFLRNLLSAGLKDNSNMEKGVLTGILRVARESLFSGLNNLDVFTILQPRFADKFGFTETEVQNLFSDQQLPPEKLEGAREWYNGYNFGGTTIYNPWSVLNYADKFNTKFKPYWINTSSNELIHDQIINGSPELHQDLEQLLNGEIVESRLEEHISFRELTTRPSVFWSLLVHAGYLKPTAGKTVDGVIIYSLAVPNREVRQFYRDVITAWMEQSMSNQRLKHMLSALISGDIKLFGKYLRDLVADALSVHDVAGAKPEQVYHAFVLGLLVNLGSRYRVESNRESGYGRYDVMLIPQNKSETGLVLEFKKFDKENDADEQAALNSALEQIQDRNYAVRLRESGVTNILAVGIVFMGKRVFVEGRKL